MTTSTYSAVICGAGIAGLAAAYELMVKHGWRNVAVVDEGDPLSLTSDKSTECYRNWWPGPDDAMVRLMNRSIDLLEEHARATRNSFRLNRRGYVYATADASRIPMFRAAAERAAQQGAGPVRYDDYAPHHAHNFEHQPDGADVLLDPALIRHHFPYLAESTCAVVHARRCGWFSSTEFGMYLLREAQARGLELIRASVTGVETAGGRVTGVRLNNERTLPTGVFINAAGPLVNNVARLLDVELPVFCERHAKVGIHDTLGIIPRDAPMLIWADAQTLPWEADEREFLADDPTTRWMTEPMPEGVHTRPEGESGSDIVLMLWAYDAHPVPATFPISVDPAFPDVVLRGLTTMLPNLRRYWANAPRPMIDGGYYIKTRENRFLAGPLPVHGAYVLGALSGYGLMAACGAAELLAAHVTQSALPDYAPKFTLARYDDPDYVAMMAAWNESGQL